MDEDEHPRYDPSLTQHLLEEGQRRLKESRRLLRDLFRDDRAAEPEPDEEL
jgi:hypothetical protein